MPGPLTIYTVDQTLRAAWLAPWSPVHRNGWTVYWKGAFIIVTGDVGDALAMYGPEPCEEGIRMRAQAAKNGRSDAVKAIQPRDAPVRHSRPLQGLSGGEA